jgi:hypothetical protein
MKTKANITQEEFLNSTLNQISQVYNGKQNCCRCGCKGDYRSTSFHKDSKGDTTNDKLIQKRLDRCKELVKNGAVTTYYETCVDVTTGNDRAMTFYFDDIKKS